MAGHNIDYDTIPGTEQLIVSNIEDKRPAVAGESDIVLIPQPTKCGRDPLSWSRWKKNYQLLLLGLYACVFSFGENTLGAAWTTVSVDTGVSLTNMNGGSALNYLFLGLINIWWMPAANIIGRRFVFLTTTCICLGTAVWLGKIHGTAQWMLNMAINGIGTSAYQAIIQLAVFDTFFAHERGRSLGFYLFCQQLGSIIGLITGGVISDNLGWPWTQYICSINFGFVFVMFFFTFEETMFPRFLFFNAGVSTAEVSAAPGSSGIESIDGQARDISYGDHDDSFSKRTYIQMLKPWTRYPHNKTTFWQYFRRPFFLFSFPNVLVAGFIYAFGCTAGIVSFNTISEILTSPPYNFSTTNTGFVFFAALVGNFLGWGISVLSDQVVIFLARRNDGIREPEMRLWMLIPCFFCAGLGYMLYGWGAQSGAHWITVAIGVGAMITHQVGACAIATTYAMESFPGISGELVVVLALCSSGVNFAMSYSVQPLIDRVGFGWAFFFFGFCVLVSVLGAIPLKRCGKRWRIAKAPRYYAFLEEVGGGTD